MQTINKTTAQLLEDLRQAINNNAEAGFETAAEVAKIHTGEYYGDTIADSIGDIAKSLRILSGREQLK